MGIEISLGEISDAIERSTTKLDIEKAKLKIQHNQWLAERLIPKVYAPRLKVEENKTVNIKLILDEAQGRVTKQAEVLSVSNSIAKSIAHDELNKEIAIEDYQDILGEGGV